jgi:hypothetical protein
VQWPWGKEIQWLEQRFPICMCVPVIVHNISLVGTNVSFLFSFLFFLSYLFPPSLLHSFPPFSSSSFFFF